MANTVLMDHDLIQTLQELGQQLRIDAVRSSSAAGSGHPTSSLSAADLMAVLAAYARRIQAFDWHTIEIDGHDLAEIDRAFAEAVSTVGQPTAVLARTRKGRGVSAVEDAEGANGKPVADPDQAIRELGGPGSARPAEHLTEAGVDARAVAAAAKDLLARLSGGLLSLLFHDPEDFFAHRTKKSSGS